MLQKRKCAGFRSKTAAALQLPQHSGPCDRERTGPAAGRQVADYQGLALLCFLVHYRALLYSLLLSLFSVSYSFLLSLSLDLSMLFFSLFFCLALPQTSTLPSPLPPHTTRHHTTTSSPIPSPPPSPPFSLSSASSAPPLPSLASHFVLFFSLSLSVSVHFAPAQCTPVFSTCHRRTNAFASAQAVPHNSVPIDMVAERR